MASTAPNMVVSAQTWISVEDPMEVEAVALAEEAA
jgi:hypothetical protein